VSADAPVIAALAALSQELDGKPCSITVFNPLGDVEWEHVDAWLATYFPRRANLSDVLRESLFSTKPARPMKDVEVALREFAG
jgi:hypothetical protein